MDETRMSKSKIMI